jgi:hypothetical protein
MRAHTITTTRPALLLSLLALGALGLFASGGGNADAETMREAKVPPRHHGEGEIHHGHQNGGETLREAGAGAKAGRQPLGSALRRPFLQPVHGPASLRTAPLHTPRSESLHRELHAGVEGVSEVVRGREDRGHQVQGHRFPALVRRPPLPSDCRVLEWPGGRVRRARGGVASAVLWSWTEGALRLERRGSASQSPLPPSRHDSALASAAGLRE